ncbi:MAG: hypothetical protein RI949_424 [Pseudomonadota bacterium]
MSEPIYEKFQQGLERITQGLEEIRDKLDPDGAFGRRLEPSALEAAYYQAWHALHDERMDEALNAFVDLAIAAPGDRRFQWGVALCLQHFGRIDDAARHYGLAYVMDPSDAACAFRLGECLAAKGHLDDARDAWNAAIQLCEVPGANLEIRKMAQAALDRLSGAAAR